MKYKIVSVVLLGLALILIGCQGAPDEPINVVIVGDEVNGEEQESDTTNWEFLELDIWYDEYEEDELPCWMWEDIDNRYPSRVAVLNEYGKNGWEVISTEVSSQMSVYFLLKRPISP